MRRYKYTIALGAIMLLAAGLLFWRWSESRGCEDTGGQYVRTFDGYECIR